MRSQPLNHPLFVSTSTQATARYALGHTIEWVEQLMVLKAVPVVEQLWTCNWVEVY